VKGSGGEAIIAALLTRDVATVGTCRRLIAGSYRGREAPMSFVCKLVVFSTQYGIAAHLSLRPEARANLIVAGHAVPDATVGYFVGSGPLRADLVTGQCEMLHGQQWK
jgi:hypothetical protein